MRKTPCLILIAVATILSMVMPAIAQESQAITVVDKGGNSYTVGVDAAKRTVSINGQTYPMVANRTKPKPKDVIVFQWGMTGYVFVGIVSTPFTEGTIFMNTDGSVAIADIHPPLGHGIQ